MTIEFTSIAQGAVVTWGNGTRREFPTLAEACAFRAKLLRMFPRLSGLITVRSV